MKSGMILISHNRREPVIHGIIFENSNTKKKYLFNISEYDNGLWSLLLKSIAILPFSRNSRNNKSNNTKNTQP